MKTIPPTTRGGTTRKVRRLWLGGPLVAGVGQVRIVTTNLALAIVLVAERTSAVGYKRPAPTLALRADAS
jgi:hypothetical protein